ncbi:MULTISPECIES: hypothetical protein [Thermomonosporaceae]|uniref:hypothetical protein n=1 Tax=Thermomonosporaceae TaxID=2012 RepID=UPI00255A8511|nr:MULTISPECIES: hypothetical protein [Thermomonosporaceae]MDL4777755.1 hypothetical protein [Actinomadura xylanilytica]
MDVTGDFEAHVTVGCRAAEIDAIARWAAEHGLKFTHIVLDRGRVTSQPMLTLRTSGTLDGARAAAGDAAARLRSAGYAVTRLKIEAAPWNRGVPSADADARDPARYFEHHLKLLLGARFDAAALIGAVLPHTAHLSRNARRVRADGRHERFVTQRCRLVGSLTAGRRLAALTGTLRAAGHEIASVEREYVVHDGDASLDEGWIPGDLTVDGGPAVDDRLEEARITGADRDAGKRRAS